MLAYWGQLLYRTKRNAPWEAMSNQRATAAESLLLDYETGVNVAILFPSIKRRHFAVTLTTLGDILLRILIIVSTGLFKPEMKPLTGRPMSIMAQSQFNLTRLRDQEVYVDPEVSMWAEKTQNMSSSPWLTGQGAVVRPFNISQCMSNLSLSSAVYTRCMVDS
jgi:hypothetical protein